MKVAVLSDIHSNYYAFRACYEDAVKCGVDRFIFLGDYVSDLSEPRKTMNLLYAIQKTYPTVCLRGNRERYMLECKNGESTFDVGSKTGSLLYTYEQLREQDFAFLSGLKIADTVEIGGIPIEIAHASMEDDRFYFDNNDSKLENVFGQMKHRYLLTGHSHKQYIISSSGKTIINPGSVGIPQSGDPYPQYAILDIEGGALSCDFRVVPYDIEEVIHAQFASRLINYAKYWAIGVLYDLLTGRENVLHLLEAVQKAGGIYDEEVWRDEAAKMGMKFTKQEILTFCRQRGRDA